MIVSWFDEGHRDLTLLDVYNVCQKMNQAFPYKLSVQPLTYHHLLIVLSLPNQKLCLQTAEFQARLGHLSCRYTSTSMCFFEQGHCWVLQQQYEANQSGDILGGHSEGHHSRSWLVSTVYTSKRDVLTTIINHPYTSIITNPYQSSTINHHQPLSTISYASK